MTSERSHMGQMPDRHRAFDRAGLAQRDALSGSVGIWTCSRVRPRTGSRAASEASIFEAGPVDRYGTLAAFVSIVPFGDGPAAYARLVDVSEPTDAVPALPAVGGEYDAQCHLAPTHSSLLHRPLP